MNKTKKAAYIKPSIEVVSVDATVGLMNNFSENTGNTPGHGGEFNSLNPGHDIGELEHFEYKDEEHE